MMQRRFSRPLPASSLGPRPSRIKLIGTALEAKGVSAGIGGLWRFFDRHKLDEPEKGQE